jgi:hypothetical protein
MNSTGSSELSFWLSLKKEIYFNRIESLRRDVIPKGSGIGVGFCKTKERLQNKGKTKS